jgi:hypothetical protein
MQRMSVDLPEPDGPHTTIFSPDATSSDTSFNARKLPNVFRTFSTLITCFAMVPLVRRSSQKFAALPTDFFHYNVLSPLIAPNQARRLINESFGNGSGHRYWRF